MPIKPVTNTIQLPAETKDDVARIIDTVKGLKNQQSRTTRTNMARDLGDHFAYISGTNPALLEPFRDEMLMLSSSEREYLEINFADMVVLFRGGSDKAVEFLSEELAKNPKDYVAEWLLASIGTESALMATADHARMHGGMSGLWELGVWVPDTGAAQFRFSTARRVVLLHKLSPEESLGDCKHPVGLDVPNTVIDPRGLVTWHYLTLNTIDVPGLPQLANHLLPMVSPRLIMGWTLMLDLFEDRVVVSGLQIEEDYGEELVEMLKADEDHSRDQGKLELKELDKDLIYCNLHTGLSPGVVGTAGGPPIGLYAPPGCPTCKRLMFHVISAANTVREYGDGFRSMFVCESCNKLACQATSWN